jgi:hypothetical protein
MDIFEKGDFQPVTPEFRILGAFALQELHNFQEKFELYDTDTTINSIRDAIVANYLGYDLLNKEKHGFDAKNSKTGFFLEVKQCSISSSNWSGVWNDTSQEKALAFSDNRLFTSVCIWKGASDLQCLVYGQNEKLGIDLHDLVVNRKQGSLSTQSFTIQKLIKDYNFDVVCPPDKTKEHTYQLLVNYNKNIANILSKDDLKTIQDI